MGQTVGLDLALWRSVTVFRLLALVGATVSVLLSPLDRPVVAAAGLAALFLWTGVVGVQLPVHRYRHLAAETLVTLGAIVLSVPAVGAGGLAHGATTLPGRWSGGLVLVAAILAGPAAAIVLALVVVAVDVLLAHGIGATGTSNATLLVLLAVAVGVLVRTARSATARAEEQRVVAEAARERERIAGDVHDTVLQTLAYLHRQEGLPAATVAALAGEAEQKLRSLVSRTTAVAPGPADVVAALRALAEQRAGHPQRPVTVTVASLVRSLPLPAPGEHALVGAVGAALDNVHRYVDPPVAGVLVEDGAPAPTRGVALAGAGTGDGVLVTVRDEGPGTSAARLAEAAAAGRLGLSTSVGARMAAAGGVARVVTAPGEGFEVLLWLPC